GIAPRDEGDEAALDAPPLDEDVPPAAQTAEPEVGTEAVDEPLASAAGMRPSEADHVAEPELDRSWTSHRPASLSEGRPSVTRPKVPIRRGQAEPLDRGDRHRRLREAGREL